MSAVPFFLPSALRKESPAPANKGATTPLTDDEVEKHITDLGRLMLSAYSRYEQSGCLGDRGEADRYRLLQAQAIRSRTPARVAAMEVERGLA